MTVLKDGTGEGFLAKVNQVNRLAVDAVTIPEIAFHSLTDGTAFQIEGETTITAATEKTVLVLINDGNDTIAIERVFVSIQGESGIVTTIKLYVGNKTLTSGGTAKSLVNLNVTSSTTMSVTIRENNPTLGGSDSKIQEFYMESTDSIDTEYLGSIILGRGNSIRVTCTGGAGAAGTKNCDVSILLFEVELEEH
jgi:hypothetical protein